MLTCILGCIAHGAPRPVIRSDKALLDAISAMKKGAPFLKFPFSQVSASFFFLKNINLKKIFYPGTIAVCIEFCARSCECEMEPPRGARVSSSGQALLMLRPTDATHALIPTHLSMGYLRTGTMGPEI